MKIAFWSLITMLTLFIAQVLWLQIKFDINCEGRLKRAASAARADTAGEEIADAIRYLDSQGSNYGYTSVVYKTPDEDVGFFYRNLLYAKLELEKVNEKTTQLEESTILMRVREVLTEQGEVFIPPGISKHPYNIEYATLFSILLCLVFFTGYKSYLN